MLYVSPTSLAHEYYYAHVVQLGSARFRPYWVGTLNASPRVRAASLTKADLKEAPHMPSVSRSQGRWQGRLQGRSQGEGGCR